MIDFRSTRPGVSPMQAAYLRLCAAIVYQAIQDITIRWKIPKRPALAFSEVERARREPDGKPMPTPEELEIYRKRVRRFYDDEKRADEYERNAKSAMVFLLERDRGMDSLAGIIGFDPEDFRSALLYGSDRGPGRGIFNDHGLILSRAQRWGMKPERFKPKIRWSW